MPVLGARRDAHIQRLAVRQAQPPGRAGGRLDEADGQRVLHVSAWSGAAGGAPVGTPSGLAECLGEERLQVFLAEAAGRLVLLVSGGIAVIRPLLMHLMPLGVDLAAVE